MAVYVDGLTNWGWKMRGRGVSSCHLIADSIAELKDFAVNKLGMKLSWYQPNSSPHFDLVESKRNIAIVCGAIELDRVQFVAKIQELRDRRKDGAEC